MSDIRPLNVFFSYSHKDEAFREQLEVRLELLRRQNLIRGWHDRKIVPGQDPDREIDKNLAEADLVLFVVSPDFIASDYCWDKEMATTLERHHQGRQHAIPVIIRPSDWKHSLLKNLQALPKDGRAITLWENQDEGWLDVTEGIRAAIHEIHKLRRATPERRFLPLQAVLARENIEADEKTKGEQAPECLQPDSPTWTKCSLVSLLKASSWLPDDQRWESPLSG